MLKLYIVIFGAIRNLYRGLIMNNNKKTAAIVSLYGNSNFGNKLQNYAVQEILKKEGLNTVNSGNVPCLHLSGNHPGG